MQNLNKLFQHKELLVTSMVAVLCLVLFAIFPRENTFQEIIISLVFLLAIPALYIRIVLRKNFKSFGLGIGNYKAGLIWGAVALLFALLILYILFNYTNFTNEYFIPTRVAQEFKFFLLYELLLVGFFTILYEFFFRGFVMFSFSEKIGYSSVVIQFLLLVLFYFFTGNMNWSVVSYIIIAPLAGWVAYKSQSLLYSLVVNLLFIIIVDTVIIGLAR